MANQLDLEEQEQLDQLKHFWQQYGNLITWALIAVLGAYAGWNGYQYWQRNQAAQAAAMFDEVERMATLGDIARVERAFGDMKDKFAGTTYAQQSGLLVARIYHDAGKLDAAKAALAWVADKSSDEAYRAIARLRLAAILAESKAYPEALAQLTEAFPAQFMPLVADRKGDILTLQGKPKEARAEYEKAYAGLDERTDYRRLVEVKLNALGVDPRQPVDATGDAKGATAAAVAASGAATGDATK
jgi:predicted negative regulator of RcsB-dependent stress response